MVQIHRQCKVLREIPHCSFIHTSQLRNDLGYAQQKTQCKHSTWPNISRNLMASKSNDRRTLCGSETSIVGSWGSGILKCSVVQLQKTIWAEEAVAPILLEHLRINLHTFASICSNLNYRWLHLYTQWLGYSNSLVNPILYTIFNQDFKKAVFKVVIDLKKILTCTYEGWIDSPQGDLGYLICPNT